MFPSYLLTPADDIVCFVSLIDDHTALYGHRDRTMIEITADKISNGLYREFKPI